MDIGVVSVRYSRALLKFASERKCEDKVYNEMQTLAAQYLAVPQLKSVLSNPLLSETDCQKILVSAVGTAPSDVTQRFFHLVFKERRVKMLQFIANSYIALYQQKMNITLGKLTTATPVSEEIVNRMRKFVESKTNGNVEFKTYVDPLIKGGFILEYDTYRLDASVSSQLRRVLKQFCTKNSQTA